MKTYDPSISPSSEDWLSLEETEQVRLVTAYHKKKRIKVAKLQLHTMIHVVVENQLAEGIEAAQQAFDRLTAEGLDRHETIHAIGSVLMEHLQNLMREEEVGPNPHQRYFDDLKTLTVSTWKKRTS